jgi:hypothetical protein
MFFDSRAVRAFPALACVAAPAAIGNYTAGRWPTPPVVNYPAPIDGLANQPRRTRQSELEVEPFLQSISAYRYVHSCSCNTQGSVAQTPAHFAITSIRSPQRTHNQATARVVDIFFPSACKANFA